MIDDTPIFHRLVAERLYEQRLRTYTAHIDRRPWWRRALDALVP